MALVEGLYVEVKGKLDPSNNSEILAEKIEAEEDGKGEDDDEFETRGVVSDYDPDTKTFKLGSITVDASRAELKPSSLDLGSVPAPEVEVEGYWRDGILVADEIEREGKKIEIQAITSAADATAGTITFTFNGTDVVIRVVDNQTEMEDETAADLDPLTLADFNPSGGDFVELEAYNDGDINAVELHRKDLDETKIEAAVEFADEATQTVRLLGADFDLSAAQYEDDNDMTITAAEFYAAAVEGVFIELEDSDNNLVIDKAELED